MNESFLTKGRKNINSTRLKEFKTKQRKQALIATLTYSIIWVCLTVIFVAVFSMHESPIRNFIYALVLAAVIIYWFVSIPFLGILSVITVQTRSRNFFLQLLPNLGLPVVMTLAALSNFIEFEENLFTLIYIGFLLIIVILESVLLRLVIKGARENKKPLFLWSFYQDSFEAYSSTILAQQALLIEEEKDGYSQRPFFTNLTEISEYCISSAEFRSKIIQYVQFLTNKNELIGWKIEENRAILYPRVLIGQYNFGLGIWYLWNLLIKVIKKKGLTSITLNFSSQELSLKISKEDYNILSDVTYHLLGQLVLERFKRSIISFLENNYEEAYSILFPLENQ
ncbi:MAG: hypothetical protein ACFE95_00230 [Candidatus Hodarchaeota archaeon]